MSTRKCGFLLGSRCWCLSAVLIAVVLSGVSRGQVVTEFPIPTAEAVPAGIAAGPDGNLWFTEVNAYKIGRISTAGAITEFPTAGTFPYGITAGPDGNLWFTDGDRIGRITTDGVITEFPTSGSEAYGITASPDGELWFTEYGDSFGGARIGRITTDGVIAEFPSSSGGPIGIAFDRDGNVWYTSKDSNTITRITPTTGVLLTFGIPTASSGPESIVVGPDGNLWFVESEANQIGRVTREAVTEFPIPTPLSHPGTIAPGPDGNLWFTETDGNRIGRITPTGVITEFPIPTAGSMPYGITTGPDGSLWFTEAAGNQIGRITTGPCAANTTSLCLNGDRFRVRVAWRVPSDGRSGVGSAVPLTGDTGYFWFFDDANIELVVKVLDGTGLNGHFWVFYGALSNVEYTITVTDTVTGAIHRYENTAGTLASVADNRAFTPVIVGPVVLPSATAEEIEARSAEELYAMYAALRQAAVAPKAAAADACAPGGTTLCLNGSRFQVTVNWEVPDQGRSGRGTAVPITGDTGYFWFFNGANTELVVKVLDGRTVNGHFWIFYAALSNVRYTITVTDSETHEIQTYTNPSGALRSFADTEAF